VQEKTFEFIDRDKFEFFKRKANPYEINHRAEQVSKLVETLPKEVKPPSENDINYRMAWRTNQKKGMYD